MGLYPDILFHFTKSFDSLKGILKDSFKPCYAQEKVTLDPEAGPKIIRDFGVPMVSFCDLRVSELRDHIESYGKFGIGLSKDWAFRTKLHPVFYINEKSDLIPQFLGALQAHFARTTASAVSAQYREYRDFFRIQSYLKHYQGRLERNNGTVDDDYRFANEREWRYVPDFVGPDFDYQFLGAEQMSVPDWKQYWNIRISRRYRLHFDADDIKYLIVDNEATAKELILFLKSRRAVQVSYDDEIITWLTSKILTYDQIINDI